MKIGDVFFTANGWIGKVVSEFTYTDGFNFHIAVHNGTGWVASRMNAEGRAIDSTSYNFLAQLDQWKAIFKFNVWYNFQERYWTGESRHLSIANMNGVASRCKTAEQALEVLNEVAHEKIVEALKPLGYTIQMEDVA